MEETEALVSIDVNTGSHKGNRKDGKNFILQANIESAVEVARQMRLRNLGGLVIVDFIDMKINLIRESFQKMKAAMAEDKAKHNILPISQLGIMQITRQRHDESNSSGIYEACPYCLGRGIVKSPRSISIEIQRKLSSIVRRTRIDAVNSDLVLKVFLHPAVLRRLRGPDANLLKKIEVNYNVSINFESSDTYHLENFKIVDVKTDQEIR